MINSSVTSMAPRLASLQVQQLCKGLFPASPIVGGRFTYQTPHDFGKKLVTLLFATPSKGFSADFFANNLASRAFWARGLSLLKGFIF